MNDLDDFLAQLRTATSSALAIVPSPPRAQPSARNLNQSIPPTASTAQTSVGADDVVPLVAHDGAVLTAAQPAIPKAQRTAPEENIHSKIAETQAALQQSREMRAALVGPTSTARSINGRSNDINGGALNKSDRLMLQSAPDSSPMQAPRLLQRDSRTEPLAASKEKMDNAIDVDVSVIGDCAHVLENMLILWRSKGYKSDTSKWLICLIPDLELIKFFHDVSKLLPIDESNPIPVTTTLLIKNNRKFTFYFEYNQ